jgi:two-component system, LytTR family, response regulator LytT
MTKIKCLIVDDEPLALSLLEKYVTQTPFLQLEGKCTHAIQALDFINTNQVDLLFLDIQMPDLTGIELGRILKNGPKIIFTTAFEQYALEGFKVNALDYLLKPINYEEFLSAASKAKEWFNVKSTQPSHTEEDIEYIFVKSDYKLVKIILKDVLYFEGLKDYVKIYLEDQPKPVLSLITLKSLESQLPQSRFMRIHRSFIIHLDKIRTVEKGQIMINQTLIPLSEQHKTRFNKYLESKSV